MTSLKSPLTIINIVELCLTIIIVGLVAGLICVSSFEDVYRIQFTDAVVFGYLIIDLLIVASGFVPKTLDPTLRMGHSILGAILWLCASALLLEDGDARHCQLGTSYDQVIAAGVLGLASSALRGVEAFFAYRGGDE